MGHRDVRFETIVRFACAICLVLLLIINAVLLAVGIFMDMTPAILIFTPIFVPVAMEFGVDPVLVYSGSKPSDSRS